jgi:hypothetical protein
MMEVELKNDGPVGVDFRSEDGAVGLFVLLPRRLSSCIRDKLLTDFLGNN